MVCCLAYQSLSFQPSGILVVFTNRGANKSLTRPGRKQAAATEDYEFHISYYNYNWRNINVIYIYVTKLA
jgi:hypothetical protein